MYGDIVEALIAAVYLDYGFDAARRFILRKLIYNHLDIEHIVQHNSNYKSVLIEFCNKQNKTIAFEFVGEEGASYQKVFTVEVFVNAESIAIGKGNSKKKAEQEAALLAHTILIGRE